MFCPGCGEQINDNAQACPKCGCPIAKKNEAGAKSRITYIILGIFFGTLGVHNFYAGRTGPAVGQLLLTLLTLGFGAIITWIWMIVEIITVTKDGKGKDFC